MRYFFGKEERLYRKKAIEHLFKHGYSFRIGVLRVFYAFDIPPEWATASLSVAFSVPKRSFKRAVVRNLLKRRLKEAWRLQKHELITSLEHKDKNLVCLIKYSPREILSYQQIEKSVANALLGLSNKLGKLEDDTHHIG